MGSHKPGLYPPLTWDYKPGFGAHKIRLWATLKPVGQTLILQLPPQTDGVADGGPRPTARAKPTRTVRSGREAIRGAGTTYSNYR